MHCVRGWLVTAAEKYLRPLGARPHWAKWFYSTSKELAPLFPRWNDFIQLRDKLDPRGVFQNPYLRRVLGGYKQS